MSESKLKNKSISSESKLKNQSITKSNKIVKFFPWILIVCGIIGLLAASILTIEKLHIAGNPNYKTSCSINPVFSCNSVIGSPEASAFGFPNPFIGIAGFALVVGVGAMLVAGGGVKNKTYWRLFQIGPVFGFLFCIWLMYETLYEIGALCLYCMITWFVTSVTLFSSITYNHLVNDIFPVKLKRIADFISRHAVDLIGIYVLICTGLILNRFWYFFSRSLF